MKNNNKKITIQIALFSLVLFLFGNINFVYAGEIDQLLAKYYEASADEDLDAYYSTRIVSEDELESRQAYTKLLWDSFDTLSYRITDIVITEKKDFSFIEYTLEAVVAGDKEDGTPGNISYKEKMIATLLKDKAGKWKIFETIPQILFDIRTENILAEKVADGTCGDCLVEKQKSFWQKLVDFTKNIITKIRTTITGTGIPDVITNVPEKKIVNDVPVKSTTTDDMKDKQIIETPIVTTPEKPITPIVEKPPVTPVVPVVKPPVTPTPPKTEPVVQEPPILVVPPPVQEEPIVVPPPAVKTFDYSPKPTSTIRSTDLVWVANNANTCTITSSYNKFSHTGGESGSVSTGYFPDSLGTYVFNLVCRNSTSGLTDSSSVTINVPAAPVIAPPAPVTPPPSSGDSGTVTLSLDPHQPFDFSQGKAVGESEYHSSDIFFNGFGDMILTCDSEGTSCGSSKKEESLSYDAMTTPPTTDYPGYNQAVQTGDKFWLKLKDGKYAKVEITDFTQFGPSITFKWKYFR